MLLICQRGGNVAKSKFDYSKLRPIEEDSVEFDTNQLTPVEEYEEIPQTPEESFLSKLPRNILIGLTHLGRNVHNLPHDVTQGLESATSPLSEIFSGLPMSEKMRQGKPLSSYLPYDPEEYGDVFGQTGEPTLMDSILQKGIEHAPEFLAGGSLLRTGAFKYPFTERLGARRINKANKLISKKGIEDFAFTPETIQQAQRFLPKTPSTEEMISSVIMGEYKPAFAMQSQIGHHARQLKKSPLASEKLRAPEAFDLKQSMLKQMEDKLRSLGHYKEADLLRGGINDYRKYMKIKEDVFPVLRKVGIPTTALAFLGFGTNKGKRIASKILE